MLNAMSIRPLVLLLLVLSGCSIVQSKVSLRAQEPDVADRVEESPERVRAVLIKAGKLMDLALKDEAGTDLLFEQRSASNGCTRRVIATVVPDGTGTKVELRGAAADLEPGKGVAVRLWNTTDLALASGRPTP